ncbi:MAG: PQQ-binding-like beta-propeller repeat protein [Bryobacterales bacterium]|nr:PQQ-binding-like beta-propeller repeat protein [Bryobacterales bacterium]
MTTRQNRARLALLLGALLLSVAATNAAQVLSLEWRVDLGTRSALAPVPIGNGTVKDGLVVALASGEILVVGPHGEQRARFHLDDAIASVTVAAARDGDQQLVYAVDCTGSVYGFRLTGERLWKYRRADKIVGQRMAVLTDLDGDGSPELLAADSKGHLYAVDARGRLRLEVSSPRETGMPVAADVDGDGSPELIFGSQSGDVYCMRTDGELLWAKQLPGSFGARLPAIADAAHDGRPEVYLTSAEGRRGLFALDAATGNLLWHAPSVLQTSTWTAVADLDGDGRDEILYGDKNTRVYAVDANGHPRWNRQVGGRGAFWAAAVARDQTGSTRIFQVARDSGVEGNSLYALDAAGQVLESLPLPGGGTSPAILVRLAGQDEPRLIVVSGTGALSCFRLPAGVRQVLSSGQHNDFTQPGVHHRASSRKPSVTTRTVEAREASGGTNGVALAPAPAGAAGTLSVGNPDGSTHVTLLRAPESRAAFTAERPGTYQVTARWLGDESGIRRFRYLLDANFSQDRERLSDHLGELNGWRASLPQYAGLIGYFAGSARTSLTLATDSQSGERFDAARRSWRQSVALLGYLKQHNVSGPLALTVLDDPWADLDATRLFAGATATSRQVRVSMLGGEFESAAVAVTNLEPDPVTVRATATAFQSGSGQSVNSAKAVEFRGVPLIRTDMGQTMEDPLPPLGDDQTLRIGPGETVKLWLRFRSHALETGPYRSTLSVRGLLSQAKASELPVALEVSPARLPATFHYKHCNWLHPASIRDPVVREAAIMDALEHGTNVFIISGISVPVAADGTLQVPDTAANDALVRRLRGKAILLVSGAVRITGPGARAGGRLNEKAFVEAVHWYVNHMRTLGLGYEDYAMYTIDEPALMGYDASYEAFVADVRRLRAADPKLQIYANPTGGATAEILAPLRGLVDIWCPHLPLVYDPGMRQLFQSGKQFWHYEADSEQRSLDPLGYYRRKPWLAYSLGMTGGGFWIYQNFSYDWTPATHTTPEWGTVYPAAKGWVDSKRWEASLDGSEDYELLRMLADRTAGTAFHAEAEQLIKQAVAFVDQAPKDQAPDFMKWSSYRQRMIDLLGRATAAR